MNSKYIFLIVTLLTLIFGCNSRLEHSFRKHQDKTKISQIPKASFLKLHFKNGQVAGLSEWTLIHQDSIHGKGTLYDYNRNVEKSGNLSFSLNDVAIVETNDLEAIKAEDNSKLAALGILLTANLILDFICLTNPKACFGSCPTFYVPGKDHLLESNAEGFSKSFSPYLEEGDIDALKYTTNEKHFQLTVKNEALETHVINEIKLLAIPKNEKEFIYHTPNDKFYKCRPTISCSKAFADIKDVTHQIKAIDDATYFSKSDSNNLLAQETIYFEFEPQKSPQLGLVINFRQTLMSTFLFYNTLSLMGDEVAENFAKLETRKFYQKRFKKAFTALRYIKVFHLENNKWTFIGQISEQGPIAKNLQMLPFPNNKNQDKIKLKLVMAQGNWRIDFLGLTEIVSAIEPIIIHPASIKGKTISSEKLASISNDDDDYLVTFSGDQYLINFNLPSLNSEQEHELFVYSKGYYLEWIRKEWLIDKDIKKFNKMMMMNKKTWRDLAHEFKAVESTMEATFWNSKINAEH